MNWVARLIINPIIHALQDDIERLEIEVIEMSLIIENNTAKINAAVAAMNTAAATITALKAQNAALTTELVTAQANAISQSDVDAITASDTALDTATAALTAA